ncbi:hypothetical protein ACTAQJ_10600 [Arthrobacter sp. alpha11c]
MTEIIVVLDAIVDFLIPITSSLSGDHFDVKSWLGASVDAQGNHVIKAVEPHSEGFSRAKSAKTKGQAVTIRS